jgi:hypothetical protein
MLITALHFPPYNYALNETCQLIDVTTDTQKFALNFMRATFLYICGRD